MAAAVRELRMLIWNIGLNQCHVTLAVVTGSCRVTHSFALCKWRCPVQAVVKANVPSQSYGVRRSGLERSLEIAEDHASAVLLEGLLSSQFPALGSWATLSGTPAKLHRPQGWTSVVLRFFFFSNRVLKIAQPKSNPAACVFILFLWM